MVLFTYASGGIVPPATQKDILASMSKRTRRRSIVTVILGALVVFLAVPVLQFIPRYVSDPSPLNQATYIGFFLGYIAIVVTFIQRLLKSMMDPDFEATVAKIRYQQIQSTSRRFEDLRVGLSPTINLPFKQSAGNRESVSSLVKYTISGKKRFIIVGRAGSGKSFTVQQMCLRAMESDSKLIALSIPVARWQPHASMQVWLTRYIEREFNISKTLAERLLTENRLLPIFDGLDELSSHTIDSRSTANSIACQFMNALSNWTVQALPAPFILTTQPSAWATLPADVRLHHSLAVVRIPEVPRLAVWTCEISPVNHCLGLRVKFDYGRPQIASRYAHAQRAPALVRLTDRFPGCVRRSSASLAVQLACPSTGSSHRVLRLPSRGP